MMQKGQEMVSPSIIPTTKTNYLIINRRKLPGFVSLHAKINPASMPENLMQEVEDELQNPSIRTIVLPSSMERIE